MQVLLCKLWNVWLWEASRRYECWEIRSPGLLSYFTKNFKGIGAGFNSGGVFTLKEDLIYQMVDYFERMVQSGEIKTMPVFGIVTNGVYMPDKLERVWKTF